MIISIPYGLTRLSIDLPDQSLRGVLVPMTDRLQTGSSEDTIVQAALRSPMASQPLRELARGKRELSSSSAIILALSRARSFCQE